MMRKHKRPQIYNTVRTEPKQNRKSIDLCHPRLTGNERESMLPSKKNGSS